MKRLQLINGVPRMVNAPVTNLVLQDSGSQYYLANFNTSGQLTSDTSITAAYDQTTVIGIGGLAANTPLTLPASGVYINESRLQIKKNGSTLTYGTHWNIYTTAANTSALYSQVTFTSALVNGDSIEFIRI